MHAQIASVIARMKAYQPQCFGDRVTIDLTSGECTPLGKVLCLMYYNTDICDLLERNERFGHPHDGGLHTFHYRTTRGNAVAFLELLQETMINDFGGRLNDEERMVANQLMFVAQEVLAS